MNCAMCEDSLHVNRYLIWSYHYQMIRRTWRRRRMAKAEESNQKLKIFIPQKTLITKNQVHEKWFTKVLLPFRKHSVEHATLSTPLRQLSGFEAPLCLSDWMDSFSMESDINCFLIINFLHFSQIIAHRNGFAAPLATIIIRCVFSFSLLPVVGV